MASYRFLCTSIAQGPYSAMLLVIKLFFDRVVSVDGILGGHSISIEEAPYQVNYGDICGGVLLHQKWAATTAHCGKDYNYIRVGFTERLRGPKIRIVSHIQHPKYGKKHEFDYDIQLLKLYRSLHFHWRVKAIQIGYGDSGGMLVAGWGYAVEKGEYQDSLHQVQIKVIPLTECQRYDQSWYNHTLTKRMFCAGGGDKDTCQGDSGSGAVSVSNGRLLGISTFGYGCGRGYPGVYINVSEVHVRSWIRKITGV